MQTKQYVHRTSLLAALLNLSLVLSVTAVRPITAQGSYTCPGNPPPRLVTGGVAVVTPGSPSNLRDEPSLSAPVLAKLPPGAQIYVVSGPSCAEGFTWWGVTPEFNSLPQGGSWTDGWIAEGQGATYFVQPLAAPLTTTTSTFTMPDGASTMTVSTDG